VDDFYYTQYDKGKLSKCAAVFFCEAFSRERESVHSSKKGSYGRGWKEDSTKCPPKNAEYILEEKNRNEKDSLIFWMSESILFEKFTIIFIVAFIAMNETRV
jgi:hypothetical protein